MERGGGSQREKEDRKSENESHRERGGREQEGGWEERTRERATEENGKNCILTSCPNAQDQRMTDRQVD